MLLSLTYFLVFCWDAVSALMPLFSCQPGLCRQGWVPVKTFVFNFYVYVFELTEYVSVLQARCLLLSDGNLAFLSGIRVGFCLEVTGLSSGLNKAGVLFCSPVTRKLSSSLGSSLRSLSHPQRSRRKPKGFATLNTLPFKQLSQPPDVSLARLCPWLLLPAKLTKKCSFCSWMSACLQQRPEFASKEDDDGGRQVNKQQSVPWLQNAVVKVPTV